MMMGFDTIEGRRKAGGSLDITEMLVKPYVSGCPDTIIKKKSKNNGQPASKPASQPASPSASPWGDKH